LQLGQGEIVDAAGRGFLTKISWGGLRAGTKLGEPAPLFPRAEKDAVERMQTIEGTSSGAANGGSAATVQVPTAKAKQGEIVSENPVQQNILVDAPVDSVGEEAGEALAYDTVAKAATAPEVAPSAPIIAAAEPQLAQPQEPQFISIDDVIKVDLRVAQILVAERIPKADKLLRLEVDLGYEKRQILAGIAQYYEPEKLIGRKIVIVANLAPRKMRGLESNGMLLAASLEGGSPVLAGFIEDVPLGARLK
jgi:methionyl-tRNA synthetase